MTRFFATLTLLSLAALSLAAQRDRLRPQDGEVVTIRGCLEDGRVLTANEPEHQTASARTWVAKKERFALSGDRDLMERLNDQVRHEVDITGLLRVLDGPSVVAVEPPQGPRGLPLGPRGRLPAGLPPDPFARPQSSGAAQGFTIHLGADELAHLVVTGYQYVGLTCLQ